MGIDRGEDGQSATQCQHPVSTAHHMATWGKSTTSSYVRYLKLTQEYRADEQVDVALEVLLGGRLSF